MCVCVYLGILGLCGGLSKLWFLFHPKYPAAPHVLNAQEGTMSLTSLQLEP